MLGGIGEAMVYSRQQEQLAALLWSIAMSVMAVLGVYGTVIAVRGLFILGASIETVSILLLFAGIALTGLSATVSSLLCMRSPSQSARTPRWFLVALCIGLLMSVLGLIGILR